MFVAVLSSSADHTEGNPPDLSEEDVKEYRDEAMKHLEAAERAETQDSALEVNAAIASSLIDIAETLHAIRASLDKLAA